MVFSLKFGALCFYHTNYPGRDTSSRDFVGKKKKKKNTKKKHTKKKKKKHKKQRRQYEKDDPRNVRSLPVHTT